MPQFKTQAGRRRDILAGIRSPFSWFLIARGASIVAYQMVGVAVGWQIYQLTRSPLDLGLVGLVQFIPSALLVLLVGHAADRYNRQRIVTSALLVEAAALLLLAAGTEGAWINRELIFMFVFALGAARAFDSTTMQTLLPALVKPEDLPRGVAINASVAQAAIIVGPVLGGFIYIIGPVAVYATGFLLYLCAALTVALIPVRSAASRRVPASIKSLFAGFSFIRSRPVLLGAISFDLFAVLLGGATALLPIYARDILLATPRGLGLLRAAPAAGAFCTSLWLARHPLRSRVGRRMFNAVTCFGLATIVFALSTSMTLSLLALAILGGADMLSVVIRSSLVQLETPDEMRGRVNAVNSVFIGASNQLGEFESGVTAAWFGVVPAAVLGGIGTLVIVAVWRRLFPQLTRRERLESG